MTSRNPRPRRRRNREVAREADRRWRRNNVFGSLRPQGQPGHLTPDEVRRMQELRDQGYTGPQIADIVGVRLATVYERTTPRRRAA